MMYVGKKVPSDLLQRNSHKYLLMTASYFARTNQLGLSKGNVKNEPTQEMEL